MELGDEVLHAVMSRGQFLRHHLVLGDKRRFGVEPHDPAEFGFEGHEIEEQSVLLGRIIIHSYALPFDEMLILRTNPQHRSPHPLLDIAR